MEPLLQISHLTKNFSDGKEDEYKAVDDVSFELFPGEKLAIIGEDWSFSMPENPPLSPRFEEPTESPARKFAKGGIVKAPTLAVVGDNAGANSGNPEVISPLNKLQGMLDNSGGQDTVILTQILDLLKRIYEMFIIFRNNGGNTYSFTAELEGSTLFEEMIRQDELYRRRHNGKSAFA